MDSGYLIAVLSLVTLIAVLAFASVSKRRTEKKMRDENAEKSTLASDADNR